MPGYCVFDTALGRCGIAWGDRGVLALQLPEASDAATIARVRRRARGLRETEPPPAVRAVIDAIVRHVAGEPRDLSFVQLDLEGLPEFAQRVYAAARAVPAGETATYGQIAEAIGDAGAARAVGGALGKNPFPIVVPCHRVLASNGKGGFSAHGGLATKTKLLAAEGVTLDRPKAQLALFDGAAARLPFDPDEARRHLAAIDPKLAALMESVGPFALKLQHEQETFDALAESIVYQQLTGKAAATIFSRVKGLFPRGRISPEAMLAMPDAKLRTAGLSGNKLLALKDLAKKTIDGTVPRLEELHAMGDDAIVERLTEVRGIGRWTVEMLLIFRLGRPDVLPVHDYGVRKGFARAYRKRALPTPKQLMKHGEKWRPFRTVASWYLWRALDNPAGRA